VSALVAIRQTDRRWWLALGASVLVHLTVLATPGWHLPTLDDLLNPDPESRIEARLASPPAPQQQPAPLPAAVAVAPAPLPVAAPPKPPPSRRSVLAPAPVVVPTSPLPIASRAEPAAVPAPVVPPASAVPAKAAASALLPKRVRIRFAVVRGADGFVVGRSEHSLTLDGGGNYTLRAVVETTGLVAMFRSAKVVQTSVGELRADGLRPKNFKTERGGTAGDMASFDWAAGRVMMSPGPRDTPAEPGMQDMLSMFYQLGLLPVSEGGVALTVVTGKKIERFVFALAGEEKISTPLGDRVAQRFKTIATSGGDTTEVWIGVDRHLPLRIRHIDRKGEIFDQIVEELDME